MQNHIISDIKKTLSLNYDPAINLNVLDILIVKSKDEKYFSDLR